MYYISTADKLQRTARWLEKLEPEGGIEFLKSVIIDDKLGIAQELERQMQALVDTYFCEWTEVVKNPKRRAQFSQFINTTETQQSIEFVKERGQIRPADWENDKPADTSKDDIPPNVNANISEFPWEADKDSLNWIKVGNVSNFPYEGGVSVKIGITQLAVFRYSSTGKWYATQNMCPHKRAFVLSAGIIGETEANGVTVPKVSCPNHKKNFSLENGSCISDSKYKIATFNVKVEDEQVYLLLPETNILDEILGTPNNMIKACDTMVKHSSEASEPDRKIMDMDSTGNSTEEDVPVAWKKFVGIVKSKKDFTPTAKYPVAGEFSSEHAEAYAEHWDGLRKGNKHRIDKEDVMLPKEEKIVIEPLSDGCGDAKLDW
ncbi:hypothetical protein HK096_009778 [Nowakowskiella sp. JEL0078]|nr:hypothetical protein HK096_009778 [Nowakowskiella sp. JEL0078]